MAVFDAGLQSAGLAAGRADRDARSTTAALPDVSPAEQAEIERHNAEIDQQIAALASDAGRARACRTKRLAERSWQRCPRRFAPTSRRRVDTPADKRSEVQKYLAEKFAARL